MSQAATVTPMKQRGPEDADAQLKQDALRQVGARGTISSKLSDLWTRMRERFSETPDGTLYIDHDREKIESVLQGISGLSGTLAFESGIVLRGAILASQGKIVSKAGTVLIEEGAIVEATIECVNLINLGSCTGTIVATRLLANYGDLSGDIQYGALESCGSLSGKLSQLKEQL